MSYKTEVLADSPYVYWELDETTGTNANDETANNRDGTYTNGPTLNQASIIPSDTTGKSVLFSDSSGSPGDDHVAGPFTLNTNTVTIEAWVYITAFGVRTQKPFVVGFCDGETSNTSDKVLFVDQNGYVGFYVYDGQEKYTSQQASALSLSTPYHIAGTYDGTTVYSYVNGAQVGSVLASSSFTGYTVNNFFVSARTNDFTFEKFGGRVDGVAMYTSALTEARLLAHYQAGAATAIPEPGISILSGVGW